MPATPLDTAAHIVQLALTPIFLLSGVAALLNVFATRLGRISDQVDKLVGEHDGGDPDVEAKLHYLRLRSGLLDLAVVLAALAGAFTCAVTLVLFLGAVGDSSAGAALFILFGVAVVLTTCSLTAFVLEVLLAGVGVRRMVDRNASLWRPRRRADLKADAPQGGA